MNPLLISRSFIVLVVLTPLCLWCQPSAKLFQKLKPESTGIYFRNDISENDNFNSVNFIYTYNGGGVAIGDLNNDGLPDIVLSANQKGPKVYLNLGHMKFKDITKESGLSGYKGWFTGVNIVDVDGDGWNDIFISRCGPVNLNYPNFKLGYHDNHNLLFINKHDLTFKESASSFGLTDSDGTTQALFLDFDNDGALDLFLSNVSPSLSERVYDVSQFGDTSYFKLGSQKLYLNKNNKFIDISEKAGLVHQTNFGLNAISCDVNFDGYPDILMSNDFISPDILYINNAGKSVRNASTEYMKHTSLFSMGSDYGDLNRDGKPDLMTADMMPYSHFRMKNNFLPFSYEFYKLLHESILPKEYIQNCVFLGTGAPPFSEAANMLNLARTDWSWSPLIQDFDNDGWQDVFVSSGTKRDQFELDINTLNTTQEAPMGFSLNPDIMYLQMHPHQWRNHVFRNNNGLTLTDASDQWGLTQASISSGAAYADLDGDGDIDLVINNTDTFASVYENKANEINKNHFINFKLSGAKKNTQGIGSTVRLFYDGISDVRYMGNTRGFESVSESVAHFGLGDHTSVDSVVIFWSGGGSQTYVPYKTDTLYTIVQLPGNDGRIYHPLPINQHLLSEVSLTATPPVHKEDYYVDFKRDRLIPFKMSAEGPSLAVGDVNNDSLEDFYLGGAKGTTGQMWLQHKDGTFTPMTGQAWAEDTLLENQGCVIADFNNDGYNDLLIANGSNEDTKGDKSNSLKLFYNDGKGGFTDVSYLLPQSDVVYSSVSVCDFNHDGYPDILAAGRLMPEDYPTPASSRLLVNHNGTFKDETKTLATPLLNIGNVRSAIWSDYDNDGWQDIVIAGEWMPITFLHNNHGNFSRDNKNPGIDSALGLWSNVIAADFDHDGDTDYVVCNYGLNSFLKATPSQPVTMYYNDFDGNGTKEQLVFYYLQDTMGILYDRNLLCEQMPSFWKKFFTFKMFANAKFSDFISPDKEKTSLKFKVNEMRTSYIENLGNGKFKIKPLPIDCQLSAMYASSAVDVNGDGNTDIVMIGNGDINPYQYTPMDGTNGVVLINDGHGNFKALKPDENGFNNPGYGRSLRVIHDAQKNSIILVGNNNEAMKFFKLNK
jgi:hypothetical protein